MKPAIDSVEFSGLNPLRLQGPRACCAVIGRLGGPVLHCGNGIIADFLLYDACRDRPRH